MAAKKRIARDILNNNNAEAKFVCVGLDTDPTKIPAHLMVGVPHPTTGMLNFNKKITEANGDIAGTFKPNLAFYVAQGAKGIYCLRNTIIFINKVFPKVLVIVDAKVGDIGTTNEQYARFLFDYLGADAITMSPYLGWRAMKPFLEYKNKLNIVLCRTSNEGSDEFQKLTAGADLQSMYLKVAENVMDKGTWNYNENCAIVFGATYADEMKPIRSIIGNDMNILIPGIGKQGGDLQKSVEYGMNKTGGGIWLNNSSAILYASNGNDFAQKAREKTIEMNNAILAARKELLAGAQN